MAVKRVFGTVDGIEVIMVQDDTGRWCVPVPLDKDGEYIVEVIAEDEAGNQSYMAKMLYTVDAGNICVRVLSPSQFLFQRQHEQYAFEAQHTGVIFRRSYPIYREVVS